MAPAKKQAEKPTYTVTDGNIVYDGAGNRCLSGDKVALDDEAAAELKAAGIIK